MQNEIINYNLFLIKPEYVNNTLNRIKKIQMKTIDVDKIGRDLKLALDSAYNDLVVSGKLLTGLLDANDVTNIVKLYIPEGMSFDDAERILKSAGFNVGPRRGADPFGRRQDDFGVLARISPYTQRFPFRTDLYVVLRSKSPGDYDTVAKINATFNVTSL